MVLIMDRWPRACWTATRLLDFSYSVLAKVWRREWIVRGLLIPAWASHCSNDRWTWRTDSRFLWELKNKAGESVACFFRHLEYCSSTRRAWTFKNLVLSWFPLVVTVRRFSGMLMSATSRLTSSLTRKPVLRSSEYMMRSRKARCPLVRTKVFRSHFCSMGVRISGKAR